MEEKEAKMRKEIKENEAALRKELASKDEMGNAVIQGLRDLPYLAGPGDRGLHLPLRWHLHHKL